MKSAMAAIVLALGIAVGAPAQAVVLDFDDIAAANDWSTDLPAVYTEDGFQITGQLSNHSPCGTCMFTWEPNNNDLSADGDGGTLNTGRTNMYLVLTRVGGGLFDLKSMDFTDMYDSYFGEGFGNMVTLEFMFSDLKTTTQTIFYDALPGLQTFDFNLTGLLSVSWRSHPLLTTDNIVVDAVPAPEPAAFGLLGLGALGIAGRCRRKS